MDTEKISITTCCKSTKYLSQFNLFEGEMKFICSKCNNFCQVEEVCVLCLGTGEVSEMEQVYPDEPHMADVGSRPCLCQQRELDEMDDDS